MKFGRRPVGARALGAVGRHLGPILVLLLAGTLRGLYLCGQLPLVETRQTPVYGDALRYYWSASLLTEGHSVSPAPAESVGIGVPSWGERQTARILETRGPGYLLFLAGSFLLFGVDPWPVRVLQALLDTLTCLIAYRLGRELAGQRSGIAAGLLAAAYPSYVLFTGRILTETLATFLFAAALLGLVRGLASRSLPTISGAGLALALAALTRPTLLAVIPFLSLAVAVGGPVAPPRRRAILLVIFLASTLAPVIAWNRYAREEGKQPVAGATGALVMARTALTATLPRYKGWRTDDIGSGDILLEGRTGDWESFRRDLTYSAAAAANLVFVHLWYLDNLWREVPDSLNALQRTLVAAAFGGLGVACARWRAFAPLLLSLVAFAAVSIKWIEIRPNLPFMIVLLVLAGVIVSEALAWATRRGRAVRRTCVLVGALALTILLLRGARMPDLALALPQLSVRTLARAADLVGASLMVGWAAFAYAVARERHGRRAALAAAAVPATLFAFLFVSYARVGSTPRGRAWEVALTRQDSTITQEIRLDRPVPRAEAAYALWLVDLRTPDDPPALWVELDGRRLRGDEYTWRRIFCDPRDRFPESRETPFFCRTYAEISAFTGAFPGSPQWWGIEIDPRRVEERERLSLALIPEGRETAGSTEPVIRIGGTFTATPENVFYGPSVHALTTGEATSLYRWHVLQDWRVWRRVPLASLETRSEVRGAAPPAVRAAQDPRLDALALRMASGEATWNVRLLVEDSHGFRAIY